VRPIYGLSTHTLHFLSLLALPSFVPFPSGYHVSTRASDVHATDTTLIHCSLSSQLSDHWIAGLRSRRNRHFKLQASSSDHFLSMTSARWGNRAWSLTGKERGVCPLRIFPRSLSDALQFFALSQAHSSRVTLQLAIDIDCGQTPVSGAKLSGC
jgi:hypothetical protein